MEDLSDAPTMALPPRVAILTATSSAALGLARVHLPGAALNMKGLTSSEAALSRSVFGDNDVNSSGPAPSLFERTLRPIIGAVATTLLDNFINQLKEPLITMLLMSAVLSFAIGSYADGYCITGALSIVAIVASVQEYRSEEAIAALTKILPFTASVHRADGDGDDAMQTSAGEIASSPPKGAALASSNSSVGSSLRVIPAVDLVVGDLLNLESGDRIPADCRIVKSDEDLTVDESSLTGEAVGVTKNADPAPKNIARSDADKADASPAASSADVPLTSQHNILFTGTLLCSGRCTAVVVATGVNTEIGKISAALSSIVTTKSPLQKNIDSLGKFLAALSTAIIAVICTVGYINGQPFIEMVNISVSLACAAIPEGLPICVTVTLALGVLRMARRNAVVKKLPAVESLGCATVVCSDKTGTITTNRMKVTRCYTFVGRDATGGGLTYEVVDDPKSRILQKVNLVTSDGVEDGDGQQVHSSSAIFNPLRLLVAAGCLCNNATVSSEPSTSSSDVFYSGFTVTGQPTEIAILVAAKKLAIQDLRSGVYVRKSETPFNSERKKMSVLVSPSDESSPAQKIFGASALHFVKGMPEAVIEKCTTHTTTVANAIGPLSKTDKEKIMKQCYALSSRGLRVLAIAFGSNTEELTFAGLIGMEDPPRDGVDQSIASLKSGGVRVVMITGDSRLTAIAIASRVGIISSAGEHLYGGDVESSVPFGTLVLSGADLDAMSEDELRDNIPKTSVFYRTAPRHKLQIVRALQEKGEVVAMTGDGVNDGPALKAADIGVAMGLTGTDVAKEAAAMVLLDDDFATIVAAVKEGKGIFFNIRNFLSFQLSTSIAALFLEAVSIFMGLPSPLNAMQILWINIIMDGPPAQSLGVEPVAAAVLSAPPRRATDPIITRPLMRRVVSNAFVILVGTLFVFWFDMGRKGEVTRRDTTMTFMTFVNFDLFNAYCCRSSQLCFYEMDPFSNKSFLYAVGGSMFAQILVIYFGPLRAIFQTVPLSIHDMALVFFVSSSIFIVDTLRKWSNPNAELGIQSPTAFVDSLSTGSSDWEDQTKTVVKTTKLTYQHGKLTAEKTRSVTPPRGAGVSNIFARVSAAAHGLGRIGVGIVQSTVGARKKDDGESGENEDLIDATEATRSGADGASLKRSKSTANIV